MNLRVALLGVAAVLGASGVVRAAGDPPSYTKDVVPFLTTYCMDCHNSDKAKSGYSVETFAGLTKMGKKGALVVPAKPDESRLLLALAGKGKQMPPRKAAQPKTEEIAKVRDWIKAGAKDDTPADEKKAAAKGDKKKGDAGAARKRKGDDDDDDDKKVRGGRKNKRDDDD